MATNSRIDQRTIGTLLALGPFILYGFCFGLFLLLLLLPASVSDTLFSWVVSAISIVPAIDSAAVELLAAGIIIASLLTTVLGISILLTSIKRSASPSDQTRRRANDL